MCPLAWTRYPQGVDAGLGTLRKRYSLQVLNIHLLVGHEGVGIPVRKTSCLANSASSINVCAFWAGNRFD